MDELARCQEKAAELVLGDEAWRGELPDETATPLLDWALRCTDAALQARASGGAEATDALADAAYAVAEEVRAVLGTLAQLGAGESEEQMWQDLQPHLGPPLFASPEDGQAAIHEALGVAGLLTTEAVSDTPPEEPEGEDRDGGFRWE